MTVLIDRTSEVAIREICAAHDDKPDALLEILHHVQGQTGYLLDSDLVTIAHALNISRAEIHGVVSFYHDYRRRPPARHRIQLCRAEACQAAGGDELARYAEAKFGEAKGNVNVGLEAVYCLGNCALGPALMIDGVLFGRVDADRLDALSVQHIEAAESGE